MRVFLGKPRTVASLAVATAIAAALTIPAAAKAPPAAKPVYLQANQPIPTRVADLLKRMTLEEKVGQMTQIVVLRLMGNCKEAGGNLNPTCMKAVLADAKVGSIMSGAGNGPGLQTDLGAQNTPRKWAEMVNAIQKYAVTNTRLRIPVLYGTDAVHGHNNVLNATLFPHQIGLGASWNPPLAQATGTATAKALKATGITWTFGPMSDLARDARWGRFYETYSEDPVLAGAMAAGAVTGYQAGGAVAATMKHFAGYSQALNGRDRAPAELPMRYLRDTILPSYKAQIDAGVRTVMVNSGVVNGVPVHASRFLLTDVLRKQWKFSGVVLSDWEDIRTLQTKYHLAADYPGAIALAVNAGVDMAMEPYNAKEFTAGLLKVVKDGRVKPKRIDEAVAPDPDAEVRAEAVRPPVRQRGPGRRALCSAPTGRWPGRRPFSR